LFHLTPVAQGHPGGTNARGAGGVDQQANVIRELRFAGPGAGGMTAVMASIVLSRFHSVFSDIRSPVSVF
jgi:hypothetical protein